MRDTCKHVQPVFGSVLDLSMISVYHVLRLNLGHKECKCICNYIYNIHIIINIYSVYNVTYKYLQYILWRASASLLATSVKN